jgi:hypothetical protein
MLRHFFAEPDFLTLLRFWNDSRTASGRALWKSDLALVPSELLPNLIVVDWLGEPRYRHVGSEFIARFGADPTGQKLAPTLGGAYADYIRSLGDEVIARGEPIFSASIFEVGDELMTTGRLFTPFTNDAAAAPGMILSVQLFSRADFKLSAVGRVGFVNESQRLLLADVPLLCDRLAEARRYHHLARLVPSRPQAGEWADIARGLTRSAIVALQPFREAIG